VRDELSGEEFSVKAKVVVNASGPWTDLTNGDFGMPTRFMGGTKGSHIVLDNPELLKATKGREIFFENSDGRIVLIYPLKGRVLVGTTDIDADPAERPVITEDEIDYFFDLIAEVYPRIGVDRSQIVYTFSGIRPLPRHDDTAPGFVSRDYRIVDDTHEGTPILSLVGGKWTTFRALAEHLSSRALQTLGRPHRVSTAGLPVGGGTDFPRSTADRERWIRENGAGHPRDLVERMLTRYGTRAVEVLAAVPVGSEPIAEVPGYYREELAHLARTEQVVHLMDVLLRRTSLAFVGGMTPATLRAVADAVGDELGWDAARRESEVASATDELRTMHRVDLPEVAATRS
jgi:glycerol-3-phosphate dehydrogenase